MKKQHQHPRNSHNNSSYLFVTYNFTVDCGMVATMKLKELLTITCWAGSLWPHCGFSKNVYSKERAKPVFGTFNQKSHFSWKFHWNSSSCSEYMKKFSVNINYFHRFSSIFWIFLTISSYNETNDTSIFFTFNVL